MRNIPDDELERILAEYLEERERRKNVLLIEIDYPYKNMTKLNKEIVNINKYYDLKMDKLEENSKNIMPLSPMDVSRKLEQLKQMKEEKVDIVLNENKISASTSPEQEAQKRAFLQNPLSVLNDNSPVFFRTDEDIILVSIKRDINSIVYAISITDTIKAQAIVEAKRQGYVFNAATPIFMKQNLDLIKLSAQNDINSINFIPHDVWTNELAIFVFPLALQKGYILSSNSPSFFKNNIDIIKQSLKLDCKSGININWSLLTPEQIIEIEHYIIDNQIDFVLDYKTPINFRRNVDICIRSFKIDSNSLNYVDFEYLNQNPEGLQKIGDVLIEQKYVLTADSPECLKNNTRICLNSIKIDIHSARYFSSNMHNWLEHDFEVFKSLDTEDDRLKNELYEIRHYLMEHGYYSLEKINKFSATLLKDETVLDYYLKQMSVLNENTNEESRVYYKRIKEFITKTLKTPLKVSNLRKVFRVSALNQWEEYRAENYDYYTNLFNRICDSLEKNNNFITALNELKFLMKVDDVLDEKKYALFNAFIEYHQIYHYSQDERKQELLQAKRDEISNYAALFISKSKEDFLSEKMHELGELYKQFFVIRIDNPIVKKKVVEIKQRDMLKKLFHRQDASLMEKLQAIKNKYYTYNYHPSVSRDKISQLLDLFIGNVIDNKNANIDDILGESKPVRFDEYELFEKVSKLINRLNNHNIAYDSPEVDKYRDFIFFDGEKFSYKGNEFDKNELGQILGYKDLKYVFNKIKSEIIQIAKAIDDLDDLTIKDIESVIGECPFTDEYYEFNLHQFNKFTVKIFDNYINAFEDKKEVILDDDYYRIVCDLGFESGLIGLSMISELSKFSEIKKYISIKELSDMLANISNLMKLFSKEELSIDNLEQILDLKEMLKYADLKQISLLGQDVIKKIYSNNGFTSSSQAKRISVACDLMSAMASRKESTVPYINGSYGNYKYSMYDSTDATLLTAGLDTNACFRCCGNDNDFLHYCALDKNGFVIKLTDLNGNFIGRASGFRNGNIVFINQLRTIYDKKSSAYDSEKEAIIKTFMQACDEIVEISQNNPNEENKIDFVVVTKSYTLKDTPSNVDSTTSSIIGHNPMDNVSEDWKRFISNTKNLNESIELDYFYNDFGNYPIICTKSAIGEIAPEKFKIGDVPALYSRTRKQVSIEQANENIQNQVNKVRACYSYQTGENFSYLKIPQNYQVINGDNWYIIFGEEGILDSCYLPTDSLAEVEFNAAMEQIMKQSSLEESVSVMK